MSSNSPTCLLPREVFKDSIANHPNSDLDRSPSHIRGITLMSTSTIPQFNPVSSDLVPPFPVEVFEHIIDHSDDFNGSLCRLSLTCRAFLPRARLNLFFRIHIGHKEKLESARAFLEARSWLPPLVHCVTIRDYVLRFPFMLLAVVPSRLIAILPNLRSMELVADFTGTGSYAKPKDPRRVKLVYKPSILSIVRKSYAPIRSLELHGLRFQTQADFMGLLCALPHLAILVCHRIECPWSDGNMTTSRAKTKTLHLTHLTWVPLPTRWRVKMEMDALPLLFDMCKATLKNLTMSTRQFSRRGISRTRHSTTEPPQATIVSRLQCLRTLTLEVSQLQELKYVTEILGNMSTTSALECLNIVYGCQFLASLAFDPSDTLSQLVNTFKECIACLPLCRVVFSPVQYRKNRHGLWSPALHQAFIQLIKHKVLKIIDKPLHYQYSWLSESVMGHDDTVLSLVASPDGRYFASSSKDSTIILWDAHQATVVHEWVDQPDSGRYGLPVRSIAFSPDSRHLLSSGGHGPLKIWDIQGGVVEQVQVLEVAREEIKGDTNRDENEDDYAYGRCSWSADGAWISTITSTSGSPPSQMHLWDARTCCQHRRFGEDPVADFNYSPMSFSPDGRWLTWPSQLSEIYRAEYICVWDALEPDAPPRRLPLRHDDHGWTVVGALSFNPTSTCLVAGLAHHDDDSHHHLHIWDIATGSLLGVLEGHTGFIVSAVFSPDGQYVLSASYDGTAKIWLTESGERTLSLEGHAGKLNKAFFSPDGNCIATASEDSTVRLWRMRDGSCLTTFTEHRNNVRHIVFSSDGTTLASGDEDGVVCIRHISHISGQ